MEIGKISIALDEEEQEVWARANTFSNVPLSGIDLNAILTEHTETPHGGEPEDRKIPAADYGRASSVLEEFISRQSLMLDSGILSVNHIRRSRSTDRRPDSEPLSVREARESVQIARTILGAVNGDVLPVESADNPAA